MVEGYLGKITDEIYDKYCVPEALRDDIAAFSAAIDNLVLSGKTEDEAIAEVSAGWKFPLFNQEVTESEMEDMSDALYLALMEKEIFNVAY